MKSEIYGNANAFPPRFFKLRPAIKCDELMEILAGIISNDEQRMVRMLLSNTTLRVRMNDATTHNYLRAMWGPHKATE